MGLSKRRGSLKLEARGRGLAARVCTICPPAAPPARPWAGGARVKRPSGNSLFSFKENLGFLKVGGLPGAPRREVLGPLGALRGASGRSLGAGGSFQGARRALGGDFGSSGELIWRLWGHSWRPRSGFFHPFDTMRHRLQQNSKLKAGRESRIHAKPNTQGVTTAIEQGFGQPQRASKLA